MAASVGLTANAVSAISCRSEWKALTDPKILPQPDRSKFDEILELDPTEPT